MTVGELTSCIRSLHQIVRAPDLKCAGYETLHTSLIYLRVPGKDSGRFLHFDSEARPISCTYSYTARRSSPILAMGNLDAICNTALPVRFSQHKPRLQARCPVRKRCITETIC